MRIALIQNVLRAALDIINEKTYHMVDDELDRAINVLEDIHTVMAYEQQHNNEKMAKFRERIKNEKV